jgi:hypothetical protein
VKAENLSDLAPVKAKHGVPKQLESCHTAVASGYVIEGHVPADTIKRLLKERPAVAGLAVPGMPAGSAGMETAGQAPQRYQVISFEKNGRTAVFETH